MAGGDSVHIFSYLDYRHFLRDLYAQKKASERGFSHRAFSKRAGLNSTNYLHLVMQGKRNLSPEMAASFARGCGLTPAEAIYFCELVTFTQASTSEERNRAYDRLARHRRFREVHQLDVAQAEYHSTWYIPAIRELAARADFRDDPAWVARMLVPPISSAEARSALSILLELGLLVKDEHGHVRQPDELVSTGPGPLGHQVVNYHRAMLARASEAIDRIPRDEREISSVTLCVSHSALLELKARIGEFRRELLQLAELEGEPERVVQINFQLFPLSKKEDPNDEP
ncbi:MAG TPA: TIGR02147 family protein [Polyangiaceae bacterium]|nr:TIGR02147 family protein [Polyangiaceae bacterium]